MAETNKSKYLKPFIVTSSILGSLGGAGGLIYLAIYFSNKIKKIDNALQAMYLSTPDNIFSLKNFNFIHNALSQDPSNPAVVINSFTKLDRYIKHGQEACSTTNKNMAEFLKYIEEYSKNHPEEMTPEMSKLLNLIQSNSKTFDKVNSQASYEIGLKLAGVGAICLIGIAIIIIGFVLVIKYTPEYFDSLSPKLVQTNDPAATEANPATNRDNTQT